MSDYNYNRNNPYPQGGYQQGGDYLQGGAGAADSYYNEGSGGRQQQHQPPPYGQNPQGYNPQGNQGYRPQGNQGYNPQDNQGYNRQDNQEYRPPQGNQGYNSQAYPPRRDDRDDDRRDNYDGSGPDGGDGERGVMGALAGGAAGAFGGAKIGGKATGHSKTSAVVGALAGAFAGHKLQDAASDWKDERDDKKEEEKKREEEEKRKEEEKKKRKEEEKRRDEDRHDRPNRRRGSRSRSRSRHRSRSRSNSRSSRHSHRDDRHRNRSRSQSRSRSRSRSHDRHRGSAPRGGDYAGHFTASSRDIELENYGDYSLRASCRRADGSYQSSSISLNKYLENIRGSFRWVSGGGGDSGPRTVTVQPGDTLRNIASRVGVSFEEIARHNGLHNPDLIHPGQVIQIPGGGGGHCRDGNFGASARHVRLVDGGQRLEAELGCGNGEWARSSVVLDERIANNNGTLRFV